MERVRFFTSLALMVVLLVGPLFLASSSADAQGAAADIVRTNDGVTAAQTPAGVAAAQEAVAAEAAPAPPEASDTATLRLETRGDVEVTFYRVAVAREAGFLRSAEYDFGRLCSAPCSTTLPSGVQRFALSIGDEEPLVADPIEVGGDMVIEGEYVDRSGLRLAGWIVGIGGGLTGAGIMVASSVVDGFLEAVFWTGLGVLIAAAITQGILVNFHDYVVLAAREAEN